MKQTTIYQAVKGKYGAKVTKEVTSYAGLTYSIGITPNGYQTIYTPSMPLAHLRMLRDAVVVAIEDAERNQP